MVIVIGIVIALTGLVLPAASQMWRDRKLSDTQNMVSGMLMVARAKALESTAGETGLFFYVDDRGVQHAVAIAQDPNDPGESDPSKKIADWRTAPKWRNVFTVARDRTYVIPAPMRVVPRYIVCESLGTGPTCEGYTEPFQLFTIGELSNNKFVDADVDSDHHIGQLHRNFFSIVYTTDGELTVRRDVLIRDVDGDYDPTKSGDAAGEVTGLKVGITGSKDVSRFYDQEDVTTPKDIVTPSQPVDFLITDKQNNAINFPSVDGLLVYDDALFNEITDAADKRRFLMETSRAFYIQRMTGAVVRGPVGEGPPTP